MKRERSQNIAKFNLNFNIINFLLLESRLLLLNLTSVCGYSSGWFLRSGPAILLLAVRESCR